MEIIIKEKPAAVKFVLNKARFGHEQTVISWVKSTIPARERSYDPDTHIWTINGVYARKLLVRAVELIGADEVYVTNATPVANFGIPARTRAQVKLENDTAGNMTVVFDRVASPAQQPQTNPQPAPRTAPLVWRGAATVKYFAAGAGNYSLSFGNIYIQRTGEARWEKFRVGYGVMAGAIDEAVEDYMATVKRLEISTKSHYATLGVSSTATTDEIKLAWRNRIKLVHPDTCNMENAPAAFRAMQEAYEGLRDDRKRKIYDLALKIQARSNVTSEPIVLEKKPEGRDMRDLKRTTMFEIAGEFDLTSMVVLAITSIKPIWVADGLQTSEWVDGKLIIRSI